MARLTDDERAFFEASDSLTYDHDGRTVLRGLSYEETEEYLGHWRRLLEHEHSDADSRERFLVLHRRHLGTLGVTDR
jgi:hypothetical protein